MTQIQIADRVRKNTSHKKNQNIDNQIERSLGKFQNADEAEITGRIQALDKEWDIERYIEVNAPIFAGIGLVLGLLVSPYWFILSFAVLGFLALHAIQGWCPPVPLFRWFGIRTQKEIEMERQILKHLRGDFTSLEVNGENPDIQSLIAAASCTEKYQVNHE